ncbi:hypothetical protein KAZ57_04010, partial [Patescibacteria group bacterium]|nr:hypothetical protein [Patescibacteria group bacterium]
LYAKELKTAGVIGDEFDTRLKDYYAKVEASQRDFLYGLEVEARKMVLVGSVLVHDLGKRLVFARDDQGEPIAYGHEEAGVKPARELMERLFKTQGAKIIDDITKQVLPLVAEHMRPTELWNNQKNGINTHGAMRKLVLRLAKGDDKYPDGGDTDLYMLSLVAEADKRGRNEEKGVPLPIEAVDELADSLEWFMTKAKEISESAISPTKSLLDVEAFLVETNIKKPGPEVGVVNRAILMLQNAGEIETPAQAFEASLKLYAQFQVAVAALAQKEGVSIEKAWSLARKKSDPTELLLEVPTQQVTP